jgi:pectate lyase
MSGPKVNPKKYRRVWKTTFFEEQRSGMSRMDDYIEIAEQEDGDVKMTFGHNFFDDKTGKKPSSNGGCAHAAFYTKKELRCLRKMLDKIL